MNPFNNILIIANVWPEPTSSAAGTRMMQLIEFFREQNAKITFACTAHPSDFVVDLESLDVKPVPIVINSNSFDDFLLETKPSMVIFDRFVAEEQFGWRVMKHCPNALRILNTEDLHFLRDVRQKAVKSGTPIDINDRSHLSTERAIREISSIYRSDISLFVSEVEIELLTKTFEVPDHLLHYYPLFSKPKAESVPNFEERNGFVFIGNFRHEPNWDSVRFIKEKVWKLIRRELPNATMNIYGAYPSPKVVNLHNEKEGFLVHGRATDAESVLMNARVCLSPLRFGAGIKGKFLDAMRVGTPSVTTAIGSENMLYNNQWYGGLGESTEELAQEAIDLYQNKERWIRSQELGYKTLEKRYNSADFTSELKKLIDSTYQQLEEHRSKSYTAQLMQQQTVMSAHYMSLWIMEKDRR